MQNLIGEFKLAVCKPAVGKILCTASCVLLKLLMWVWRLIAKYLEESIVGYQIDKLQEVPRTENSRRMGECLEEI